MWLNHPHLSKTACLASAKFTEPYMDFIYAHRLDDALPDVFTNTTDYSTMAHGSQWFEPYRQTADIWWTRYRKCKEENIPGMRVNKFV
jgi:hypothetical protein